MKNNEYKLESYNNMLLMWLWAEIHNVKISSYLLNQSIRHIAIYGLSEMGECLYYELEKGGIKVEFVIDNNEAVFCECPVYSPHSDFFPHVDLIIVTVEHSYVEIVTLISSKTDSKIICFQQLLCDVTGMVL